jgi:alkylated DNA repair dioxygenase AlkB
LSSGDRVPLRLGAGCPAGEVLPAGFELIAGWLSEPEAWTARLRRDLDWRSQKIILFGRPVLQPRLMDWYSDPGVTYRYSGLTLAPKPWPAVLSELRKRLETHCGASFNSVLCNAYRDGRDSMGWHADDEPELGPDPLIASLNLGATRRFRIRPRGGGPSIGVDLEPGSLLLMSGRSQADFQHAVPKTRRPVGLRINLTFRRVLASE